MLEELKLLAPMFLFLPGESKKHYLSFNNYHCWPVYVRTALRRAYGDLIKKQLAGVSGRFYGEVQCTVVLHPPKDTRVRDTDDHCFLHAKWANDALKETGVYTDDGCVLDVVLRAGEPVKIPYLSISYGTLSLPGEKSPRPRSDVSPAHIQALQPVMDPAVAARSYTPPKGKTTMDTPVGVRDPRNSRYPKKKVPRGR